MLTGWPTENEYVIRNRNGQQVYVAFEKTDARELFWREEYRDFIMHVVDNSMQVLSAGYKYDSWVPEKKQV